MEFMRYYVCKFDKAIILDCNILKNLLVLNSQTLFFSSLWEHTIKSHVLKDLLSVISESSLEKSLIPEVLLLSVVKKDIWYRTGWRAASRTLSSKCCQIPSRC